jgi:hypothetical protein
MFLKIGKKLNSHLFWLNSHPFFARSIICRLNLSVFAQGTTPLGRVHPAFLVVWCQCITPWAEKGCEFKILLKIFIPCSLYDAKHIDLRKCGCCKVFHIDVRRSTWTKLWNLNVILASSWDICIHFETWRGIAQPYQNLEAIQYSHHIVTIFQILVQMRVLSS